MKTAKKETAFAGKLTAGMLAALMFVMALAAGCSTQKEPGTEPVGTGEAEVTAEPTEDPNSVEKLKAEMPFYVDPETAVYDFGEMGSKSKAWNNPQTYTPYWLGNIIYHETVLCVDDGTTVSGELEYTPVKILSVRDYTFETEYAEGTDYTVNGRTITLPEGSACPYLTAANLKGTELPKGYSFVASVEKLTNLETQCVRFGPAVFSEGSFYYGHQLCVSYVYDISELKVDSFGKFGSVCPKTLAKLQAGEEKVVFGVTGDSVTAGCSASAYMFRAPYIPIFMNQFLFGLKANYSGTVAVRNLAVGGTTSREGAKEDNIKRLVRTKADTIIIHFGLNDIGSVSAFQFRKNIEAIVNGVRAELPDCEFLFIKCSTPNPDIHDLSRLKAYFDEMDTLAASVEGFYTLDMFALSENMLANKRYADITGNGVNHLNDYMVRLYAMQLLNLFVDYKNS